MPLLFLVLLEQLQLPWLPYFIQLLVVAFPLETCICRVIEALCTLFANDLKGIHVSSFHFEFKFYPFYFLVIP